MTSKGLWERKERVTEQENEWRGREEEEEEKEAADTSKDFPSAKAATHTLLSDTHTASSSPPQARNEFSLWRLSVYKSFVL